MSEQPPAKRKRVESLAIIRSPELWFDDGSVVLQAQNTQFRVHWGVLSNQSTVFRDMRGLPQPPDQDSVEGCPVIELSDSADDVEYLLDTLYHPPTVFEGCPVVRYNRCPTAGVFQPTKREQYIKAQKERWSFGFSCVYNIFPHRGILFDTLTLARENKLLSVLSCAYYRVVAEHSQEEILNGLPGEDGTLITLSPEDQQICILARPKLIQAQFQSGGMKSVGLRDPSTSAT
ncbi:hypothetical protein DFH06DRAFT_1321912 [Mycena polygramma]|nr:hypothetical protein DFH06DRAFT_1321912 [Mycena polygramma]